MGRAECEGSVKHYKASDVTIKVNGVELKPFGVAEWSEGSFARVEASPGKVVFGVDYGTEVPFDSVSRVERERMEADARIRAEDRLREWRRNHG